MLRQSVTAVLPGLTFLHNANLLGAVIEAARAAVLNHAFFQHSRNEFADAL